MTFLKENVLQLNHTSIKKLYENYIEGQDMEWHKSFFVPFDSTKLDLNIINNIVKNRAASSDKGKKQRRKLWHQCVAKSHYLKNISRHTRKPIEQTLLQK